MENKADQTHTPRLFAGPALAFSMLALAGCFGEGIQTTVDPKSDATQIIQDLYVLVTWIDIGIFIAVFVPLIYALWRFRDKKTGEIPKQVHGNVILELTWTIVPAILLVFIAVPTWVGIFRAYSPPTDDAFKVEAIGHQWWWEFNYPNHGIVTANELHIPVHTDIVVDTFSKDVIHSIWMPKLAAKIDTLPGHVNTVWFNAREEGYYYGQCAEFCGISHANMRFRIIVESEEKFKAWMANQSKPPVAEGADAKAGQRLFAQKACVACHTIKGVPGAVGVIGPNLNDLKTRTTLASGILKNTPANLARWIRNPQKIKPGALMVLPVPVNEQEASQLAAYLLSEPGAAMAPAAAPSAAMTPSGGGSDAVKGKQAFMVNCVACHGTDPAKDGPIGPAIAGSSIELVTARVMNGSTNFGKSYPPGYKPKRTTRMMAALPHLKGELGNIAAYLQQAK
ncbi:MAG: cytochrome c oxidase subunit II [SAR324 cluster bacterium]|nr:cytochrome c oxidase subunit II [SAR324 cluster bacterium]